VALRELLLALLAPALALLLLLLLLPGSPVPGHATSKKVYGLASTSSTFFATVMS
jgi:hypothetical protein